MAKTHSEIRVLLLTLCPYTLITGLDTSAKKIGLSFEIYGSRVGSRTVFSHQVVILDVYVSKTDYKVSVRSLYFAVLACQ
jgi:hypothetical protein